MKLLKTITIVALLMLATVSASAGAFKRTGTGFKASAGDCNVQVSCYGPNIIRVEKYPLGTDCPEVKSFAVTKVPGDCRVKVMKRRGNIVLKTNQLVVTLDLKSSVVKVTDRAGKELSNEKPGGFRLEPVPDVQADRFKVSQTFVLDEDEHIYGLGQHQQGHFDMRGTHVHLENVNMEVAIPIIHSSKGYALFWDNTAVTEFDDSPEGMKLESVVGRKSDYYVIYGGSADGVVAGIRDLTGQVPMMPLWSFGFNQSKERYGSQEEIVGVVERFRELGVPLDGIIQDWQYWSTDFNYWNAVEWGNPGYPDPEAMLERIHSLNAHCTISVWPSFGPKTNIYKDLEAAGVLMPHSTFPQGYGVRNYDPFKEGSSEIYWSYMKKYLFDAGIDGWWLDATEPERQPPILDEDLDYETPFGTFRDLRNAYPIATVGGVYDAQRASDNAKRVFILTRSAAAGQQRYGSQVWSGDVVARWDVLAAQIPAAINYSLCGLPYWNLDIGGFFVPGELYPEGNANPGYRRLYLRWMQFGAFTGMMRSHGTSTPREIFNFGEPGSFDFDAQAKFINLRYRLLPYIYSASYQVSSASASLMRPLFAEFPDDGNVYSIPDEYFFGKSILVAPVSTDDNFRTVYLPEGNWFDFWNGGVLQGGREFTYDCALDSMPLFVPAGSIVPVGPAVEYASQKPWDSLQIRIYPGADAEYELYEDAGDGYGYLDGESSVIRFVWDDKAGKLTVEAREGGFPGMLAERDFNVVLVREGAGTGLDNEACDVKVHYDGSAVTAAIK